MASGFQDAACAAGTAERPNIVIILADDLGWKDLGFRGSKYYETPHLDQLASQSVEFLRAYACPSCAPSRAALLTGQYSPRTGVFMVGRSDRGNKQAQRLTPISNREDILESPVTMASVLREAGYATAIIGKWHLGEGASSPEAKGFEVNVAATHEGTPPTYFSPYQIPTIKDGPTGEYLTDRLTDEAVKFIARNEDRPFFLYLPHYAVHVPIEAKKEAEIRFAKKAADGKQNNAAYAAMIQSLDEGVGRLIAALDSHGLSGKTHIIFTSDNGGQMGITGQAPLREGKGWLYEGGVRVPMLIHSPGTTAAGTQFLEPVHLVDIFPTVLDWAGLQPPGNYTLDGYSLAGVAMGRDASLPARDVFWHFPGYQPLKDSFRITPSSMLVNKTWKLIERFEDGSFELYNLILDEGEKENLAASHPEIVSDLRQRLGAWRDATAAQVPRAANPDFKP